MTQQYQEVIDHMGQAKDLLDAAYHLAHNCPEETQVLMTVVEVAGAILTEAMGLEEIQ